ncbi:GGDEF domain-containing protein [Echinimonas agarilytica]|uniref:diguanylate cyclase n=1 Tax=Echinimonas agarilytica TaxID=1215918 RepID=A0AA41W5K6_9GAMM|nr:GGDEF domain-containing protein [Echinimonas agarilytica]
MELVNTQKVFVLLALLLPVNWLVISYCHDQPALSPMGFMAITIGVAELLVCYLLYAHEQNFDGWLQSWLQVQPYGNVWQPLILQGVAVLCLAALGSKVWKRRLRFDIDIFTIMVINSWMLANFEQSNISSLSFLGIELILLGGLVSASYQMAFHDELTKLPGRRALVSDLKHASRHYCMAMTDVDHFKKFNDTYGHDIGDDVLKLVAAKLGDVTGGGKSYRYGGEEFAVVFRGKSAEECRPHLEALREVIANYPLSVRNKNSRPEDDKQGKKQRGQTPKKAKTTHVTISLGVADRVAGETYEEVMKRADQALYKAKENGRNRVEFSN